MMDQLTIGEIIKEYRERIGVSQEDICGPDLAVSTVSNVENGKEIPQNDVINTIFSHLGLGMPMNLVSVSEREYKKYALQFRIENLWLAECPEDIGLIEQFKEASGRMGIFDEQFYHFHKGLYLKQQNSMEASVRSEMKQHFLTSIMQTLPQFTTGWDFSEKHFLTSTELHCLLEYALACHSLNETETSDAVVSHLSSYLKKGVIDTHEREKFELLVMRYQTMRHEERNLHEDMLSCSEKGIKKSLVTQNFDCFLFFLKKAAVSAGCLNLENKRAYYKYMLDALLLEIDDGKK